MTETQLMIRRLPVKYPFLLLAILWGAFLVRNDTEHRAFGQAQPSLQSTTGLETGQVAEAREKLGRIRPTSISQASRISGITPADIALLMVYLENRKGR